jgi:hypothetical protein
LAKSINYEVPHHAAFSNLLLLQGQKKLIIRGKMKYTTYKEGGIVWIGFI